MLISLILGSPSFALTPSDDVHIGQEPTRLLRFHTERQHVLRNSEAWQQFTTGEGTGWKARFDEHAGTIHRAWGPGIEMGDLQTLADAEAAVRDFLDRNPGLLSGVSADDLVLGKSGYSERTQTWYVQLDRQVNGVPVWRSSFTARIKYGRLIMIGAQVDPGADAIGTEPALTEADAVNLAISQGPSPEAIHLAASATPIILPYDDGSGVGYRLCWLVRSTTHTPPGSWVSFVDAYSGELINVHNEVRFLEGYIYAEHDERYPDGTTAISALRGMELTSNEDSTTTSESGYFSLSGSTAIAVLESDEVVVDNQAGRNGELTVEEGDNTWTDADATLAEIDTYFFLHQVRDWAREYAPGVNSSWYRIESYVNINSSCNAYFDGTVNFYTAGSGCNNTGRISDVIFHEWGHGFHYYNLISGSWDGSISEGIGDTIAFFHTEDPTIAPYFYTSGGGIREVSTDRVYPDDWVNQVHTDGLIFGGAVWDLWSLLREGYDDESEADDVMFNMFADALLAGPTIPESYDEFVVADDDNGDLGDGTPHLCYINDAFGRHGLGPGDTEKLIELSHTPLGNQPASAAEYPIDADVVNYGDLCGYEFASGTLHYSTDEGSSWQTVSLSGSAENVTGAIPGQAAGTHVLYFLEATATDGSSHYSPAGGEITPLSFYIGELIEIYCEDFEDDDGDFTSELIDGEDSTGADDWMWGEPEGYASDPDFAFSGDNVWGNDLGGTIAGQSYNGEYQADKHNRLSSTEIDLQGYETIVVQFQRWLNVEDGYYDQARVLLNEEIAWENYGTGNNGDAHHQDSQWALQTLVAETAEMDDELVISWEIESDGGLEFGGWNIDDVCVYGLGDLGEDSIPGGNTGTDTGGSANLDGGSGDAAAESWSYGCGCASTGPGRTSGGLLIGLWLAGIALLRRRQG